MPWWQLAAALTPGAGNATWLGLDAARYKQGQRDVEAIHTKRPTKPAQDPRSVVHRPPRADAPYYEDDEEDLEPNATTEESTGRKLAKAAANIGRPLKYMNGFGVPTTLAIFLAKKLGKYPYTAAEEYLAAQKMKEDGRAMDALKALGGMPFSDMAQFGLPDLGSLQQIVEHLSRFQDLPQDIHWLIEQAKNPLVYGTAAAAAAGTALHGAYRGLQMLHGAGKGAVGAAKAVGRAGKKLLGQQPPEEPEDEPAREPKFMSAIRNTVRPTDAVQHFDDADWWQQQFAFDDHLAKFGDHPLSTLAKLPFHVLKGMVKAGTLPLKLLWHVMTDGTKAHDPYTREGQTNAGGPSGLEDIQGGGGGKKRLLGTLPPLADNRDKPRGGFGAFSRQWPAQPPAFTFDR